MWISSLMIRLILEVLNLRIKICSALDSVKNKQFYGIFQFVLLNSLVV